MMKAFGAENGARLTDTIYTISGKAYAFNRSC